MLKVNLLLHKVGSRRKNGERERREVGRKEGREKERKKVTVH